jgi:hypothetical protein
MVLEVGATEDKHLVEVHKELDMGQDSRGIHAHLQSRFYSGRASRVKPTLQMQWDRWVIQWRQVRVLWIVWLRQVRRVRQRLVVYSSW